MILLVCNSLYPCGFAGVGKGNRVGGEEEMDRGTQGGGGDREGKRKMRWGKEGTQADFIEQ